MKLFVMLCLSAVLTFAQTAGAVVGAGYSPIAPISVSPGQVITIFVTGVGSVTQKVSAGNPPLPSKLGGISGVLNQGGISIPAPVAAVFPVNACSSTNSSVPCGTVTGITLQVPFELRANIPGTLGVAVVISYLQVSDDAGHTASVLLNAQLDSIHVLRSLDTVMAGDAAQPSLGNALVTHADGSLVTATNPAQVGEVLVMYAVGLGAANPPVKTGVASPAPPVPAAEAFSLNYDYRPNASPSPGLIILGMYPPPPPSPLFVGLTPGFVGLDQFNFIVQSSPAGMSPCARSLGIGANPFASVSSNLTVTLVGRASFDGAGICVGPPAP